MGTDEPLAVLHGHRDEVNSVALFEHEQQLLALSASHDATVRVWDLSVRPRAEETHARQTHGDAVDLIACSSAAGSAVTATATWPAVHVWDATGSCTARMTVPLNGSDARTDALKGVGLAQGGLALTPDGSFLATARSDGQVDIVGEPGSATPVAVGSLALPGAGFLSFAQTDGLWLVASAGDAVVLIDPARAEVKRRLPVGAIIVALAALPQNNIVAVALDDKVVTLDILTGQVKASLAREAPGAALLAFALAMRDGKPWLLSYEEGTDSVLLRDALASGEEELALEGQGTAAAAVGPLGRYVAIGSESGTLSVWDVAAGEELMQRPQAHAGPIDVLRWSADGKWLVTGGQDGGVKCWAARQQYKLAGGHVFESAVSSLALIPGAAAAIAGLRTGEVAHLRMDAVPAVHDPSRLGWGDADQYPQAAPEGTRPPQRIRTNTVAAASGTAAAAARQAQKKAAAEETKRAQRSAIAEGMDMMEEEDSQGKGKGGCCVLQ